MYEAVSKPATLELPKAFLKALPVLGKVINKHTTVPILSCVRVRFTGDAIVATTTDLDVMMEYAQPTHREPVMPTFDLAIPATELLAIVKGREAVILAVDGTTVTVYADGATATIEAFLGDEFPPSKPKETFELPYEAIAMSLSRLADTMKKVLVCTSSDEARGAMFMNIALRVGAAQFSSRYPTEREEVGLSLTSTDGYRLAHVFEPLPAVSYRNRNEGSDHAPAVIARSFAQSVGWIAAALGRKNDPTARLMGGREHFRLVAGNFIVTSRIVVGRYPHYEQIIPKQTDAVIFDRSLMIEALKSAAAVSNDRASSVKLAFADTTVTVSAKNSHTGASYTRTIATDGRRQTYESGFNGKLLLSVLASDDSATVSMEQELLPPLGDKPRQASPACITSGDSRSAKAGRLLSLMMPLRN